MENTKNGLLKGLEESDQNKDISENIITNIDNHIYKDYHTFYKIILDVKPTPKGRPRFTRFGHAYTPKKTLEAEEEIKYKLISWKNKNNFKIIEDRPIELEIRFNFSIPKSYSRTRKMELLYQPHIIKPDCDNLQKVVCDAMNGIIFKDDSLVYKITASKTYYTEDLIEIIIKF